MQKDEFYSDADWKHVRGWMSKLSEGIGDEQLRHDPSHAVRGLQSMFRAASQALLKRNNNDGTLTAVTPTLQTVDEDEEEYSSDDEDKVVVVQSEDGNTFHACASTRGLDAAAPHRSVHAPGAHGMRRLKSVMSRATWSPPSHGAPSIAGMSLLDGGSNLGVLTERHDEDDGDSDDDDTFDPAHQISSRNSSDPSIHPGTSDPSMPGVHDIDKAIKEGKAQRNKSGRMMHTSVRATGDVLGPLSDSSDFGGESKANAYDGLINHFVASMASMRVDTPPDLASSLRELKDSPRVQAIQRAISQHEVTFVQLLAEARHRFLNLVKSKIWEEFNQGYLTKVGVSMLMNAASFSQDVPTEPLSEWNFLSEDLQLNHCTQALLRRRQCMTLGMRLLFRPLVNQFDVATSFIRIHNMVQDPFQDLIVGHTHSVSAKDIAMKVARVIIDECNAMVEEARELVKQIESYIPKTVRAIKTEQVIHALLKDSKNTAKDLLHHGELEEKEYTIIDEALTHLHKKVRVPKQLQLPSLVERLRNYGMFKGMDDDMCAKVEAARIPRWYPKGEFIYRQGEVALGVYVVFGGKVSVLRRHSGTDNYVESRVESRRVTQDGYKHTKSPMMRGQYFKSVATMNVVADDGTEMTEEVLLRNLPRGSVVGLLSMLTGQPMLTSVRCDSLVDGVWFDEWTIGKLLKSKRERKGDPVKVPTILHQNLCQMAARTVTQLYIPRLRRIAPDHLAAMLDQTVLVRPVPGSGLLIKGHALLLTGALMERDEPHLPGFPAPGGADGSLTPGAVAAVPTARFLATGMHSVDSVQSSQRHRFAPSDRSVGGDVDHEGGTWSVTQSAVSFLEQSPNYRHFSKGTRLLVVRGLCAWVGGWVGVWVGWWVCGCGGGGGGGGCCFCLHSSAWLSCVLCVHLVASVPFAALVVGLVSISTRPVPAVSYTRDRLWVPAHVHGPCVADEVHDSQPPRQHRFRLRVCLAAFAQQAGDKLVRVPNGWLLWVLF